jgi:hypothetical protein
MSERDIPTPSNLVEIRRYVDKDAGEINEYIPRNPAQPVEYYGMAHIRFGESPFRITVKLPGPTLEDAIAGWSDAVNRAIDQIERDSLRAQLAGNA